MIGNAVPVRMGKILAEKIYSDLNTIKTPTNRKFYEEVNGTVVKEKLSEIVNRMSA